jgi:hypothetical protein
MQGDAGAGVDYGGLDTSSVAFALHDDGSAVHPEQLQRALQDDPTKMQTLQQHPEVMQVN